MWDVTPTCENIEEFAWDWLASRVHYGLVSANEEKNMATKRYYFGTGRDGKVLAADAEFVTDAANEIWGPGLHQGCVAYSFEGGKWVMSVCGSGSSEMVVPAREVPKAIRKLHQ